MKKAIALLLAMGMIIASLAGCGTSGGGNSDGTKKVEVSSDVESSAEAVEHGVETSGGSIKTVAYIPLMTSTDFHLQLTESIVDHLKDAGYDAEYTSPDGDITKQIEIVENYVAQGVDCIVIFPLDGNALSDAVARAREQGVKVVVMVNITDTYDAAMESNPTEMGNMLCEMASDWVDERFPDAGDGEVKCALVQFYNDNNTTCYSDAMAEIEKYNSKIKVVTTVEEPDEELATGQSMAENLAAQYPDINLFMITSGTVALGFNAYYTSLSAGNVDLSKIGAFSINGNNDTYQAIVDSANDNSMYRGIILAATIQETGERVTTLVDCLNRGDTNFPEFPMGTKVDASNAAEYLSE